MIGPPRTPIHPHWVGTPGSCLILLNFLACIRSPPPHSFFCQRVFLDSKEANSWHGSVGGGGVQLPQQVTLAHMTNQSQPLSHGAWAWSQTPPHPGTAARPYLRISDTRHPCAGTKGHCKSVCLVPRRCRVRVLDQGPDIEHFQRWDPDCPSSSDSSPLPSVCSGLPNSQQTVLV